MRLRTALCSLLLTLLCASALVFSTIGGSPGPQRATYNDTGDHGAPSERPADQQALADGGRDAGEASAGRMNPREEDRYMVDNAVAGELDSGTTGDWGFGGHTDDGDNIGACPRHKRDVTVVMSAINRCIATCGARGEMALLCRRITTHTVSLIRALRSHNGTEASMQAVTNKAAWLLEKLLVDPEHSEEMRADEETEATTTAAAEETADRRHYRSAELAKLETLRIAIAGIGEKGEQLVSRMDEKTRGANGTIYDCTGPGGRSESAGGARRGSAARSSSIRTKATSAAAPRSMAILKCSIQMKLGSIRDLVGCIGLEIAKGGGTDTYPTFYLGVLDSLYFILRAANGLDKLAMARTIFDYGDPLARPSGN